MVNAKTPLRNLANPEVESPLEAVLYETVRLFHRLRVVMEELHQQGELSSGKSGILRGLDRHGSQTVPQMARARPVSRQYIQTLVNPLLKEGLVELLENPAHKKSSLVSLTETGKERVREMRRKEKLALERLGIDLNDEDLRLAQGILEKLRRAFESPAWQRSIRDL
jgi:DNA-binding MarR family transcriptional regulator